MNENYKFVVQIPFLLLFEKTKFVMKNEIFFKKDYKN